MSKLVELEKRIAELEKELALLKARPPIEYHTHHHSHGPASYGGIGAYPWWQYPNPTWTATSGYVQTASDTTLKAAL